MRETKIDNVYIFNSAGLDIIRYPITQLKEAAQHAKKLSDRNNSNYTVKIVNEYIDENGFSYQKPRKGV